MKSGQPKKVRERTKRMLLATACLSGFAGQAEAQEAASGAEVEGGIQEIIVTAQKRSESVQDVGITMSVLTSDSLANLNVRDVAEVAVNIPNVQ
ncbi:hypothetical protein, partial [Pseudomonas sp. C5pp]